MGETKGAAHEWHCMKETFTRRSQVIAAAAGTAPVNQVRNAYLHFGQLTTRDQTHRGVVNTSSSSKVQDAYEDGSAKTTRPTTRRIHRIKIRLRSEHLSFHRDCR
jgi:hypothetical protein